MYRRKDFFSLHITDNIYDNYVYVFLIYIYDSQ